MSSGGGSRKKKEGMYSRDDMRELDAHWKKNYEQLEQKHEAQTQQITQMRTEGNQLHNVERAALLGSGIRSRREPMRMQSVSGRGISPVEEAIVESLGNRDQGEEGRYYTNPYLQPRPRFAQPPGY